MDRRSSVPILFLFILYPICASLRLLNEVGVCPGETQLYIL